MDQSPCVSSDVLHFDVWVNVLTRLPARYSRRLRCVSKSWRSLIDSSYFKKMRLDRRRSCLLAIQSVMYGRDIRYWINDGVPACKKELELPLDKADPTFLKVVGCCNGLICLTGWSPGEILEEEEFVACLWNPFSGEHRTLDHRRIIPFGYSDGPPLVYGFGMDATTRDYKIVRITYSYRRIGVQARPTGAAIYSLRSDTWRSLGHEVINFTCLPWEGSRPAFVNGAVHWLAQPAEDGPHASDSILSFDIAEEVFREIRLPADQCNFTRRHRADIISVRLAEFQHKLALFACDANGKKCSVWLMKEYGVAESWSKLHDLSVAEPHVQIEACKGSTEDGQILLHLSNCKLVCCDAAGSMDLAELKFGVKFEFVEVSGEPGLQLARKE